MNNSIFENKSIISSDKYTSREIKLNRFFLENKKHLLFICKAIINRE